jgi:putative MATE family efflux protein
MAPHDMTTGSIRGHLLRMTGFILLPMIGQVLYGLIDAYWVGWLGRQALAAVMIASVPMLAVTALTQLLAVGTGTLVAQAVGRQDGAAVCSWFSQSQLAALVLGALTAMVLVTLRVPYSLSQTDDAWTARLVESFLVWFIPALVMQFPIAVLNSALRGIGDVRSPSLIQLGMLLINIVLAPVLMFGWATGMRLGVPGAALATLIAAAVGAAFLSYVACHRHLFASGGLAWRPRLEAWRQIIVIGSPSAVEAALIACNFAFVIALLRPLGPAQQAAFGLGMRLLQAAMIPLGAMFLAVSATVGQNYGARLPVRIRETFSAALTMGLAVATVFVLLYHVGPRALLRLFSTDSAVVDAGEDFLTLTSWNLLASAGIFACAGVFAGLGNTLPSLVGSAIRIGLFVITSLCLSRLGGFSPHWLWLLYVLATFVQLIAVLLFAQREMARKLGNSPVDVVRTVQK